MKITRKNRIKTTYRTETRYDYVMPILGVVCSVAGIVLLFISK